MYHANVNVNLMVENVTQIKSRITINVGVSVKKIMFGILIDTLAKLIFLAFLLNTIALLIAVIIYC